MNADAPSLAYAREPAPGSLAFRDGPDGSIDIEMVPKSPAQMLPTIAACVAVAMVVMLVMVILRRRGVTDGLSVAVVGFVLLHVVVALPLVLYRMGRKRLYISAGPKGLSIHTTEHGDAIRHDWERAAVADVRVIPGTQGENIHCIGVFLRGRGEPVPVWIYRRPAVLKDVARRIRTAMGMPGR
jgi:hypothetical protein